MKYCIIDDEPIAHRIIEGYCENLPFLQKEGNCYNAFEAMQILKSHQIDLLFLDINMPKVSGLELLKMINPKPKVIVTSAHKEFALEGFELDVSDYLLKPFSFERFLKAINKVMDIPKSESTARNDSTSFFLKGDKKLHQIHTNDVLFVEAYGNYCKVFLEEEIVVTHAKISELESMLSGYSFLRVHKSFIIAINKIKTIEGNRIMIKNHKIPIGQTYKSRLKSIIEK